MVTEVTLASCFRKKVRLLGETSSSMITESESFHYIIKESIDDLNTAGLRAPAQRHSASDLLNQYHEHGNVISTISDETNAEAVKEAHV